MIEKRTERPAFGVLLRERRIAARLSQEQLAERAQISVQAVSALERGARRSPRADTLALLTRSLALEGPEVAEFVASAKASVAMKVRHDPAAPKPERGGPAAATTPALGVTSFIGRELERTGVVEAFASHRCVTLWGPGGVGKTRLATETFSPLAATFGERIAFVALAAATDGESMIRAISAAYDLVDGTVPALLRHLAGRLTGARTLLVIDNCEHLVDHASRFVAAALAALPDLSILTTSREPLLIDGERVFRIGTLAVPPPGMAEAGIASLDAVKLFLDRAAAGSGTPPAAFTDLSTIATICRRLDGLPLAIELAASRVRSMSVREIERALDERFSLLTRGGRSLDPRQRTLRDTIGWSYELLDRPRRVVFERLALLNGPFSIEHAVAIASDSAIDRWTVVNGVADLVDKALIGFTPELEVDAGGRAYTMLESTRLYAVSLAESERADSDRIGAHLRFGTWLLDRARESFDSFFYQSELDLGPIDIDHLRGYFRWAIDGEGDVRTAATIAGTLMHWWSGYGITGEALRWTERALDKLGTETADFPARIFALLGKTSLLRNGSYNKEACESSFEAHAYALRLSESDEDRRLLARTSFFASESAAILNRQEEARRLIRLSMETYAALGDEYSSMLAVSQEARIASIAGDRELSRRHYTEAMVYFRRHGYRRFAANQLSNLAEIEYALGDVASAIDMARASSEVILELSSSYYVANSQSNLAAYLHDCGTLEEVAEAARRALDVASEAGLERIAAWACQSCAIVAILRGHDPAGAAVIFGYTLIKIGDHQKAYTEQRRQDRLETLLHERLSEEAFAAALERGRELGNEEAYRLARAALP